MMNFKQFFEVNQRELKKTLQQQTAWKEFLFDYLKQYPVQIQVKTEGVWDIIIVNFEGHNLELKFNGSRPILDGKPLSSADPRDALDFMFIAAGRQDLKRPSLISRNYILYPPDYITANQIYRK